MIKKIRRKFIIISMCSVFAVLALIIGIINVVNYVNVVNNADHIVNVLKDGNGGFGGMGGNGGNGGESSEPPQKPMSPETPFETRFFTVEFNNDGNVVMVNTEQIAAISEDEAQTLAVNLYKKSSEKGFYGKFRYGVTATPQGGTLYVFVDCTRELAGFNSFLWISIAVSAGGFAVVFLLVYFLSRKILNPITESYSKQKSFITNVSHDIKTPLTIIGADAEVLEMQYGQNEWTSSVKSEVKRLASLTEKLVFLTRMDEDNSFKLIDFCISETVKETVKAFEAVALSRGISIELNTQENLTYCGDEVMISQMLSLLIDNAIKYSDRGSEIRVDLIEAANKIHLTVQNKNTDLPDGNLDYLFERFYRSDKSRNSETGGHGIGLSVVQSIVAAHKGKIVTKKEKDTVSFTIVL